MRGRMQPTRAGSLVSLVKMTPKRLPRVTGRAQRRGAPFRANPGPVMIKGDCAAVQITVWGSLQESRCAFFTISENKISKLITTSPFQSTLVDDS